MKNNTARTTRRPGRRLQRLLAALGGMLAAALPALSAEVFLCRAPERPVLYSQFPCPESGSGSGNPAAQEPLQLIPLQTLRIPPLSEAERRRLEALGRQTASRQSRRLARRASQMRSWSRERQRQQGRCSAARRQIEALAARRRKGYSMSEARELDARERTLDAEIAETC